MNKLNNKEKGFSLVEVIIAGAMFVMFISIAITLTVSFVGASANTQEKRKSVIALDAVLELLSRDIRLGEDYKCPSGSALPIDVTTIDINGNNCSNVDHTILFTSGSGKTVSYRYWHKDGDSSQDKILYRATTSSTQINAADFKPIIDVDILKVMNLTFEVDGASLQDNKQPYVKIDLTAESSIANVTEQYNIKTVITQRARDIQ